MTRLLSLSLAMLLTLAIVARAAEPAKVAVGEAAPAFKIKTQDGKTVNLAELTAKGPVLVRLTCGCSGCDKELAYFQEIHDAYKGQGLTSLVVFSEPDAKVAKYAEDKKLNMLYAVDTKGDSWNVFQTKTMPTNFLIDKGGKIVGHRRRLRPERPAGQQGLREGRQGRGRRRRQREEQGGRDQQEEVDLPLVVQPRPGRGARASRDQHRHG